MLKVFLVEDESIVRESLRDNIPWNDYGFEFAGEAGDGEMALPLIRKTQPDLLITDIRMPFMDGLSLTHIVKKELPQIKVIIISGYDDFEYARRALTEGVDQYIMKPITRKTMWKALTEIRDRIDQEKEQQSYLEQYKLERREFEQLQRREFMEKVFTGTMPVEHIYEEAGKLGISVDAECYNLILFSLRGKGGAERSASCEQAEDALMLYFMRYPAYFPMEWNLGTYCVLIRGTEESTERYTKQGIETIRRECMKAEDIEWYATAGEPVKRFSSLKECFERANHAFACRFWKPEEHILTEETAAAFTPDNDRNTIASVDVTQVNPEVVIRFLKDGDKTEVDNFVTSYLDSLSDVLKSRIFRGYLTLNVRFTVIGYLMELGISQDDAAKALDPPSQDFHMDPEQMKEYFVHLFEKAMDLQEVSSVSKNSRMVTEALRYIDANYTDENLSLNSVAEQVHVSAGYLSAAFSREQGETFVEYLTQKRMALAGKLLKEGLHTAEVASRTGYRDPHYFSFVFRKTQGMSPKDYRAKAEHA